MARQKKNKTEEEKKDPKQSEAELLAEISKKQAAPIITDEAPPEEVRVRKSIKAKKKYTLNQIVSGIHGTCTTGDNKTFINCIVQKIYPGLEPYQFNAVYAKIVLNPEKNEMQIWNLTADGEPYFTLSECFAKD